MEIRITFTSYLRFHGSISDSSNNHNRYVTMYNKNTNNLNCVKKHLSHPTLIKFTTTTKQQYNYLLFIHHCCLFFTFVQAWFILNPWIGTLILNIIPL